MSSIRSRKKLPLFRSSLQVAVFCLFLLAMAPAPVSAGPLAAGSDYSASINTPGSLWLWGDNSKGQLATQDLDNRNTPTIANRNETDWNMVSAGNSHTVVLRDNGSLWSVGSNENGQLGLGLDPLSTSFVDVLTRIGTDNNWTAISAGGQHTLALKSNGSLWAFGSNTLGQLGIGTSDDIVTSPVQISAPGVVYVAISAGGFHSLAIRRVGTGQSGSLWSWGSNLNDVLGIVTNNFTILSPTQVGTATDWSAVSAGGTHSLALKTTGTLWGWGRHREGQLGLGPQLTVRRRVPEQIETGTNWIAISAGDKHSLGLRGSGNSGALWAWGLNSSGQLGLGGIANRAVPEQVGSASSWNAIAAGKSHTLAGNTSSEIFSVGKNTKGQLGSPAAGSSADSLVGPIVFSDPGPGDMRPDFSITNVVVDSDTQEFVLGQTVNYSFNLNNLNEIANFAQGANPAQIRVFLSTDNTLNLGDELVDTVNFPSSLAGGASVTIDDSFVISLTTQQDTYFIIFSADETDVVEEANEDNNIAITANTFEIFGESDFRIDDISLAFTELRPGGTITFDVDVTNLAGNYPADAVPVPIEITLSIDGVLGNTDDVTIGNLNLSTGLASGEVKTVSGDLTLPTTGIRAAQYIFIAKVNPSESIEETDLNNNFLVDNQLFSFRPDFSITSVGLPVGQFFPGDTLDFSYTVLNSGADHTAGTATIVVEVVLSTDDGFGNDVDTLMGVTTFNEEILFGASITRSDSLIIPNVPSGLYSARFRVNSNNAVSEISTGNNNIVASREFRFFPDFVVTEVLIPSTGFIPNSVVGFKVTGQNVGGAYTAGTNPPLEIAINLSQDDVFGNTDDVVLQGVIQKSGDLAPGESFTDSLGYIVPSSVKAGIYKVATFVDSSDVSPEIDDDNNIVFSNQTFELQSDLEITAFTFTPAPAGINREVAFDFSDLTLTNNGAFDLPAGTNVTLEVRLSLDRFYGDINDILLITDYSFSLPADFPAGGTLDVVAAGGGDPFNLTIPAHTPTGNYHVAARVDLDNTISEADEDNNIFFSADDDVLVTASSLSDAIEDHLAPVDQKNFTPILGGNSSWYGQDLVFNPADGGAAAGQAGPIVDGEESFFELQVSVLAESEVVFSWMVDSEASFDKLSFTVNGSEVVGIEAISGQGGGWIDERTVLPIGTHLLRFTYSKDGSTSQGADTGYVDSFEINPIGVVAGAPDFILENIFIDKTGFQLSPVEVVDFQISLRNLGADFVAGPSPVVIEIRLSSDNLTFDAGDSLIGTVEFGSNLSSGVSAVVDGSFQISPSAPKGNFFIAFKVDPDGLVPLEVDSNNTAFSDDLFEVLSFPDLVVLNVDVQSIDPRPGGGVTIESIIGNPGDDLTSGAPTMTTEVRLTADEVVGNADDIVVGSFNRNVPIPSGTSISSTPQDFTFPDDIDFGDYRIAVIVDSPGTIEEDSEVNNTFFTPVGTPFTFSPDFEMVSVSVPDTDLVPGDDLDFSFTVRNNAANLPAGAANLDTEIILSLDTNFDDPSDVPVTIVTRTEGIDFDQSFTTNSSVALPADIPPGQYFVGFRVNPSGTLVEIDADNNGQFSTVTYRIFPDFVITELLIPTTTFTPGSALGFKVTGLNRGAIHDVNVGDPGIVISLVLTLDDVLGNGDDVALTAAAPITFEGDILNGETRIGSQAYTVPAGVTAGTYLVAATIDSAGSFSEIDEFNNSFFSTQSFDLFSDLEVTVLSSADLPGSLARGALFEVTNLTITNNTDFFLPAGTDVVLQLRLSEDRVWGNIDDSVLEENLVFTLLDDLGPAGATAGSAPTVTLPAFNVTIPSNTPIGDYFIGAFVDPFAAINEADDDNNIFFTALPDLEVTGVSLAEALEDHLAVGVRRNFVPAIGGVSAWFGQTDVFETGAGAQSGQVGDEEEAFFEVLVTIDEESDVSFFWRVSSEAGFDFLSFTVNGDPVDGISPISGDVTAFLPASTRLAAGSYALRWTYSKDFALEANQDTAWVDSLTIAPVAIPPTPPDFELTQLLIDKPDLKFSPIEPVNFTVTVTNVSAEDHVPAPAAPPVDVDLRLSPDLVFDDPADALLANVQIPGILGAGESIVLSGSFTIDGATVPGFFRVGAFVDPADAVNEIEETINNSLFASGTFEALGFPDLAVGSATISVPVARPQENATLDINVRNFGDDLPDSATPVEIEVFLTRNAIFGDGDDIFVGSSTLTVGIDAGGTLPLVGESFTLPASLEQGNYVFMFRIDPENLVAEQDENNNVFIMDFGAPANVVSFNPDFLIENVAISPPDPVLPEAEILLSFNVTNQGADYFDLGGGFPIVVDVVLSVDGTFGNGDDLTLGSITAGTAVSFGNSLNVDNEVLQLPSPIDSDSYFLALRVNSAGTIVEDDSSNNTFISADPIRIDPDFTITNLELPNSDLIPGSTSGFKVTAANLGANYRGADNITVQLVLTTDNVIGNGDDHILGTGNDFGFTAPILSGDTPSDSQSLAIPDPILSGTYIVGARIDPVNLVGETDESNNTIFSIRTFDLLTDLQVAPIVSGVDYDPDNTDDLDYDRGEAIVINNITIENTSLFDAPGGTAIQVRLSKDRIFGNLDDAVLVSEITIAQVLGAGDSVSLTTGFNAFIPDDTPAGDYFLAVRVDFASEIPEIDETNNTLFSDFADITILGTDLANALEDHSPANPIGITTILGGVSSWFAQTSQVEGGTAAGQSGAIGDGEESFFEISVFQSERFELSFHWNVSSEDGFDFLIFSINGEETESISGDPGAFVEVVEVLDPGSYTFRWTYRKDPNTSKLLDTGWVDTIEINAASGTTLQNPDFVISSADFQPGTFVVQRDSFDFNAIGINIGGDLLPIPSDTLEVEAVLTIDQEIGNGDDILLGSFLIAEPLDESNQFVYRSIIPIPETNRAGTVVPASANYFLGLRIDPPTASKPVGNFTELDENNNILISDQANIVVETRPDIDLDNFTYTNGQFSFGESILLSFDMINNGLQSIPSVNEGGDPVRMQVVLNNDEFTSFNYTEGLAIGERRFIQLSITVQEDFPISTVCGNVNVLADTTGVVAESNENNNTTFNTNLDVFVTGIDIGEAIDVPELRWVQDGPTCAPWTGQSEETLDGVDAINSPASLLEGQSSNLSSTVFIDKPTFVSFAYMGTPVIQIKKGDEIITQARLAAPVGAGIWAGVQVQLDPGDFYTFTFISGTVILEAPLQDGEDTVATGEEFNAGTGMSIDELELSFPEIALNSISLPDGLQTLARGDTIDLSNAVIEIVNTGAKEVPANTPLVFQFRLSLNQVFGDDDDILLRSNALGFLKDTHTVQLDDALVASDNPLIPRDVSEFFTLNVSEFASPGDYFLGAFVNFTGVITEVDIANNVLFTNQPIVRVVSGGGVVTLDEALDLDAVAAPVGPLTSSRGLEVPWFGQGTVHNGDGDAAQSPFLDEGNETAFEVPVPGPAEVTFFWKSDTLENLNSVELFVDGVLERRITGNVDWQQESVVLGLGDHTLRWVYQKGKNHEGSDVGYIDNIVVNIFDLEVTDITVGSNLLVNRGGAINGLSVTVTNNGNASVGPPVHAIEGEVRLSLNSVFGDADDVILGTFQLAGSIAASGNVALVSGTDFNIVVPATANPGVYTVAVTIDSTNAVNETNEGNNVEFDLETPNTVTVDPATTLSLSQAMDTTFTGLGTTPFVIGGDASWFGLDTTEGLVPADSTNTLTANRNAGKAPNLGTTGQTAFFQTEVPGPFRLRFDWKIVSAGDTLSLSIDSVEVASIIGTDDFDFADPAEADIDLNIQAGSADRLIRWTYTRNNDGDDDPAEKAFVDNLRIDALTLPDLIITSLDFSAGTFVIQQNTPFDVTVIGVNAGVPMTSSSTGSQLFDVEIRLSTDKIWGNSDDIVLGKLNEIEQIADNGRFVFTQSWILSNPYTEGDYFVAAFVDSTEIFDEFDEVNNFSFSENADVTLDLRPNLRLQNLTFRTGSYFKNGEIQVQFDIVNTGFEDFPIGESFQINIDLKGQFTDTFDDDPDENVIVDRTEITQQTDLDRTLVTFSDDRGIRSDLTGLNPPSVTFNGSLKLPAYNETDITDEFPVFSDLAVVDPNPTGTPGDETPILIDFALDITVSSTTVPLVSSSTIFLGNHNINILARPFLQVFNDFFNFWNAEPGQGGATVTNSKSADDDSDGFTNLQEFAFGMDPREANAQPAFDTGAAGLNPGPAFGMIQIDGEEYLSVTFNRLDVLADGELLDYVVEVSENGTFNDAVELIRIDTNDTIDDIESDTETVSVIDNDYLHRVTIRDVIPVNATPTRFIRIVVIDN